MWKTSIDILQLLGLCLSILLIASIDYFIAPDMGLGVLYVLPCIASILFFNYKNLSYFLLCLCSGFNLLILFTTHQDGVLASHILSERLIYVFVLWVGAFMANRYLLKSQFIANINIQFRRDVEKALVKRTEELQEKESELRQSQKMEAIGRLAGGIAHDFNSKLGAIMLNCNLLDKEITGNEKAQKRVARILNITEDTALLTQQILAFGRKQRLQIEPHNIQEVLGQNINLVQSALDKNIELKTSFHHHIDEVLLDSHQFSQALLNIVMNSKDAMSGGGTLEISSSSINVDKTLSKTLGIPVGKYICINIIDDGAGMSEEVQERILEPFYTTKPQGEGTGLGLSTAAGIIEQSGGFLLFDSELDRGTAFQIYLPTIKGSDSLKDADL